MSNVTLVCSCGKCIDTELETDLDAVEGESCKYQEIKCSYCDAVYRVKLCLDFISPGKEIDYEEE